MLKSVDCASSWVGHVCQTCNRLVIDLASGCAKAKIGFIFEPSDSLKTDVIADQNRRMLAAANRLKATRINVGSLTQSDPRQWAMRSILHTHAYGADELQQVGRI